MEDKIYTFLLENCIGKKNLVKNYTLRKLFNINSDKSLTDNNQENPIVKEKSIVLKKASDEEEKEYLQNHMSVDEMIRKYDISKILPQ